MPTLQDSAPGSKSSKFTALDPFAPFLAQPGDNEQDDGLVIPEITTRNDDTRLRSTTHMVEQNGGGTYGYQQQYPTTETVNNENSGTKIQQQQPRASVNNATSSKKKDNPVDEDDDDEEDSDSDFDDLLDDDPAIEAFRRKRLAELKASQIKHVENVAKGHGEYRTITQDEFLPECTGSEYVAIHFFHNLFERCKIIDMHIKKICRKYTTCKFLRIDAEKCPFFITKLQIKTLPTLVVFKDGKTIERLIGFEGLTIESSSKKNGLDEWPTRNLKAWLATTGAIKYSISDGDSDDEDDYDSDYEEQQRVSSRFGRLGVTSSRYNKYDDDV